MNEEHILQTTPNKPLKGTEEHTAHVDLNVKWGNENLFVLMFSLPFLQMPLKLLSLFSVNILLSLNSAEYILLP